MGAALLDEMGAIFAAEAQIITLALREKAGSVDFQPHRRCIAGRPSLAKHAATLL